MSTTSTRTGESRSFRHASVTALGRLVGLRPETTGYTVSRVHVPMRDGVRLVADHYAPTTSSPAGTVLVRCPYGRGFPFTHVFAGPYAARGYHVVLQSVRGTFGSGGEFEPMVNEAADGADTVAWLREQPWFTGRFATIGVSYLGFAQWALLDDPPPELATAVITAGPHDFLSSVWGTGSFAVNDFLGWAHLITHQEEGPRFRAAIDQLRAPRKVANAAVGLPLGAGARTLLGEGAPWFESWVEHTAHDEKFWERLRFGAALDRVQVPVLLLGGWQDVFLRQTLQQYEHLRGRGVDVALTIGPWTHTQLLGRGLATGARDSMDWVDTHLGGATSRRPSRVRVYVTGLGWRDLPDWPPATTQRALYLRPGRYLDETPPTDAPAPNLKGIAAATFRYDPSDPTPVPGGPQLFKNGGYRDDSRLELRNDVLAFTSATLTHDLCVFGNPVVELAHSADNPHVDLFVRVSEVDAKGRSRNISDGYQRLTAAVTGPKTRKTIVKIQLDGIAHRFRAGSRIRLLIAGSCFPRFARNLGTDEPVLTGRQSRPATHTVLYHDRSRLLLPVGALDPSSASA